MKKKSSRNDIAKALNPELHQPRPRSRGIRPLDEVIAKALRATRGKYGHAALRLECSERSLRSWVAANTALQEIVDEERTLQVDTAECVIDRILADPKHPRNFDAARFVAERRGRDRGWGFKIEHAHQLQRTVTNYVPLDQRAFQPEAWDSDEHARFAELSAIPTHELSHEQLAEIQSLVARAKVIELSPDAPLKPLPAPQSDDESDGA